MSEKLKVAVIAVTAIAALAGGGAAIAGATGGDDDASDSRSRARRSTAASAAALEHTGGGKVTETEAGDEEGAYEIEVNPRRRQPGRRPPRRGLQRPRHGRARTTARTTTHRATTDAQRRAHRHGAVLALDAAATRPPPSAAPRGDLPQGDEPVDLDPADFTTEIDNPYWPMKPGSRWVYRETDSEGTRQRVVVTVTPKTKLIANGIKARVVRDMVTEDGGPVEVTDDWYAQDRPATSGTSARHTTEYENGKPVSTAGSFEAGVDGAQPGVIMPARPRPGLTLPPGVLQGQAEDKARIVSRASRPRSRPGTTSVLMTRDVNPLEPKVLEFKFSRAASARCSL